MVRAQGQLYYYTYLCCRLTDTSPALPRSADGVYRLRDPKRPFRCPQPCTAADAKRKSNSDHHDRVEYRCRLQRQPAPGICKAGCRTTSGARRPRAEAVRGTDATRSHEGIAAGHGQVELCGRECDEGAHEVVSLKEV